MLLTCIFAFLEPANSLYQELQLALTAFSLGGPYTLSLLPPKSLDYVRVKVHLSLALWLHLHFPKPSCSLEFLQILWDVSVLRVGLGAEA